MVQQAAFTAPAAGYFGNGGTGIISGPGMINFDVTLYKDFKVTEHQKLEFRAEVFNIFNHANFTGVSTTYGSGSYRSAYGRGRSADHGTGSSLPVLSHL